jgi:acyl-CoA reductase-like NAD-dependent aldehyde dehydrogenase
MPSPTWKYIVAGIDVPGEPMNVYSPYSGALLATVESAASDVIEHALVNADEAKRTIMPRLPGHERAKILLQTARLMEREYETLVMGIAQEGGKPYTDAKAEVSRAINTVTLAAHEATALDGEQIQMDRAPGHENRLAFVAREPIGVVTAISAFNHPVNLIAHQVAPALAAGCPVVVKPASTTPLSCLRMGQLFLEAGLPEKCLSVVPCRGSRALPLAADRRVSYLTFIGSAAVGWELRRQLHPGVRVSLEHGGTATSIVAADADLKLVAEKSLKGGYYHAGQVCVSVQNILLDRSLYDSFAAMFKPMVERLIVGDPTDPQTEVGPIIDRSELDRIARTVDEAVADGAELLTGGKKMEHQCYCPTLLGRTSRGMRVFDEEIFGPVVNLCAFDDLDEAIHIANDSKFGFQSSVYSPNVDTAFHVARQLNATAVMINDHTAYRVDWMPFGGRDFSGIGMGGVKYAVHEMTRPKLFVLNLR